MSALHVRGQFHFGGYVHVVTTHVETQRYRLVHINLGRVRKMRWQSKRYHFFLKMSSVRAKETDLKL